MASGDSLLAFSPLNAELPASSYPQFVSRNAHPALAFDASSNETTYFSAVMPRIYAGNGITVKVTWAAASDTTTSNTCTWAIAFERFTSQDIDSDGFATAQSASGNPNATSGIPTVTNVAFTSGQIDGVLAGEAFRMSVMRDTTDTMTGDAQILAIELRET